jgi:hypothetical protein
MSTVLYLMALFAGMLAAIHLIIEIALVIPL